MKNFDISHYFVVGPENTKGRPLAEVVRSALLGGITFLQIRSKVASAKELLEYTRQAAQEIEKLNLQGKVKLVVNDRLDVVLEAIDQGIKVDGIHVGQTDVSASFCRKMLDKVIDNAIVGLSAKSEELITYVQNADLSAVDYLGAGPLHETPTKSDCGLNKITGKVEEKSLEELENLVKISPLPVVVGGGVKLKDLAPLKKTGVAGFFVVTAISEAEDPEVATKELVEAWN